MSHPPPSGSPGSARAPVPSRRRLVAGAVLLAGAVAVPVVVWAQSGGQAAAPPAAASTAPGGYNGVVPGTGNLPPLAAAARRSHARLLTWPGFQQRPDGASRVFIQVTKPVTTSTKAEQGKFTVILKDTKIFLRNNRRPLDTHYFNTPVTRVTVERRRRDVAVVMDLRSAVTPHVYTEAGQNGFQYVYAEFPAGDYVPAQGSTTGSGAAAPAPAAPETPPAQ